MADVIDIDALRSNGESSNPGPGKNVDGQELRDFGNGLKEFDPAANGFKPEERHLEPTDKDRALESFDKQMKEREEEVAKYNELLEQYGGEITEEELREELGQDNVTAMLGDGSGGKFEEPDSVPRKPIAVAEAPTKEEEETAALERELEEDDGVYEAATTHVSAEPRNGTIYAGDKPDGAAGYTTIGRINSDGSVTTVDSSPTDDGGHIEYTGPTDGSVTTIDSSPTDGGHNEAPVYYPEGHGVTNPAPEDPNAPQNQTIYKQIPTAPEEAEEMSKEDKDLAALEDDAPPVDDFNDKVKAELEKKLKPITKKYDLSKAVIRSKPISVGNATKNIIPTDRRTFTWALMSGKRPITMRGFDPTELNIIADLMGDNNRRNRNNREVIRRLWEHITSYRGKTFESWCKTTRYADLDHIWFAVFGACFHDTNYVPLTCAECDNVTLADNIPIMDMCDFEKPEAEQELKDILSMAVDSKDDTVVEYMTQITDNIAIGFKDPSIWDAVIVPPMLDSKFSKDYNDIIGVAAYIANIYYIEEIDGNVELSRIQTKEFPKDEVKTAKARIIQFSKVIRYLSSDYYNMIMAHINAINKNQITLSYKVPSYKCDHCGKEISSEPIAASDLVFMRHRLALLGY